MATDETFSAEQVAALVAEKAKAIGSVGLAAIHWKVSPQMVHMVIKKGRRPTAPMLDDLGLEEVPAVISYRRK